jgi:hypothetical protein
MMDEQREIACRLVGPEFAARKEQVARELFSGVERTEELSDGFAFQFSAAEPWPSRALDFIISERECCPFFRFALAFEPDGGPLWLRLTGPSGAKEFIETELGWTAAGG